MSCHQNGQANGTDYCRRIQRRRRFFSPRKFGMQNPPIYFFPTPTNTLVFLLLSDGVSFYVVFLRLITVDSPTCYQLNRQKKSVCPFAPEAESV